MSRHLAVLPELFVEYLALLGGILAGQARAHFERHAHGVCMQLRTDGVDVIQGPESHENGKFAWIMDPDGNKIELWEPMAWDDKNKEA